MDLIFHISIITLFCGSMFLSLNYISGYTGLMTLSHGGFLGISAYTVAILTKNYNLDFLLAILIATIGTTLIAYLLSFPFTKAKEDTYLFMTFGFTIIVNSLLTALTDLTGGPLGLKNIPDINIFGYVFNTKFETFIIFLLIFLGTLYFFSRILTSIYGTILKGIRDDQTYMETLGFNTSSYLRTTFTLSALIPAFIGGFMGAYYGYIEPDYYELYITLTYAIAIIIGGLASIRGSIAGAVILAFTPEILRLIGMPNSLVGPVQQILFSSILIILIYLRPKGIFGDYQV